MPIADAVDEAVKQCIKEDVLSEFLKKHRSEVMDVCITEYNEKSFVNGIREEGRAEGRIKMLVQLVADGTITIQTAAEKAGMDEASFTKKIEEMR